MVVYAFTGSFLVTTFFLQWWQRATYPWWLWTLLGIIGIFIIVNRRTAGAVLLSALIGMTLAFATVARSTHVTTQNTVDFYAGSGNVRLLGTIAEHPDRRPLQTKYVIAVETLEVNGVTHGGIHGRVLVTDRRLWPEFHYGDAAIVEGKLVRPGRIDDFRYDHYLERHRIYATIPYATIETVTVGAYNLQPVTWNLRKRLYQLKSRFEFQINRLLPEPHASLLAGLLVGSRGFLSEDLLDAFNKTGLTHIIALSGYNVTIVIGIISGFLIFLPNRIRFFPAVVAIVAFVILVGAEASVVRAGIMGILGLFAIFIGRKSLTRLTILWTATLMLLWNPLQLWYDVGFQLSFLALIGITELGSTVKSWIVRVPDLLDFREAVQMTLAAQIVAIPIIALHFDRISLIAPLANALIAIAVPFAMLFGTLAVVASHVAFPLGQLLVYPTWGFLQWIIFVAEILSKLPFASIGVPFIGPIIVTLYYLTLILWLAMKRREASASWLTTRRPEDVFPPRARAPELSAPASCPEGKTRTTRCASRAEAPPETSSPFFS